MARLPHGRLARYNDVTGAAGLPGQGAVGGRDVLERGGVGVLGCEPVVDRHGAHVRLAGQAGRQPHGSSAEPGEAAAMNVEDSAARLDVSDVDEDHGDAAQAPGVMRTPAGRGCEVSICSRMGRWAATSPPRSNGALRRIRSTMSAARRSLPFLSSWRSGQVPEQQAAVVSAAPRLWRWAVSAEAPFMALRRLKGRVLAWGGASPG